MAAIERGQGESDEVVRGWLAKALGASRGPQWICGKCNHVHAAWAPVCENCGAFDTLDWRTPAHPEDSSLADSALLPVLMGVKSVPPPPTQPAPPPDIEDAELASAADQARAAGGS
jgi:HemY protein